MRRPKRVGLTNTFMGSVGWLFADLLLALAMLFLIANTISHPKVPIVHSQAPIRTSTRTSTPIPKTLDRLPLQTTINVDPGQLHVSGTITSVKNQVTQMLARVHDGGRKVGFVITLAGGIAGVDNAKRFNDILLSMGPFKDAVVKNYHDLGHPDTEFDLEIYFIE